MSLCTIYALCWYFYVYKNSGWYLLYSSVIYAFIGR